MTEAKKDELTREEQEQIAGGKWEIVDPAVAWKSDTQDPMKSAPARKPT